MKAQTPTENETTHILIGTGRKEEAVYKESSVPNYRNNPLIEALPPIYPAQEAFEILKHRPPYSDEERLLPVEVRLHTVQTLLQVFTPLAIHLDLEQRFSRLIRYGYLGRNPMTLGHWADISKRVESVRCGEPASLNIRSNTPGFAIVGMSGGGKTTAVETILQKIYPQVIVHREYQGRALNRIQIPWLQLACPFDGSTKALCLDFFRAVDDLLDTHYYETHGRRKTTDELLPSMARVASIHCLGVLVIDEIQHLSQGKSGGGEKMLNFFVHLVNTIGLRVVLIGTSKAKEVLSKGFRQIRRASGQGDLIWERMRKDEVWRDFLKSLWEYQYVREPSPLTDEISDALYDECQGITDFAVKLLILAQVRAISTGIEKITSAIIRSVAKDSLQLAAPVLQALKSGDTQMLEKYNDVEPINIDLALQQLRQKACGQNLPIANPSIDTKPMANSAHDPASDRAVPRPPIQKSNARKRKVQYAKGSLMEIAQSGQGQGFAPYQALKSASVIVATPELPTETFSPLVS